MNSSSSPESESDPRLSPTGAPTNTDPVLRRNYSFATLQITKPKLPVSQLRLNLRASNHRNLHISETFTTRNHKKIKTQFRTKTNRNQLFYIFLKRKYEIWNISLNYESEITKRNERKQFCEFWGNERADSPLFFFGWGNERANSLLYIGWKILVTQQPQSSAQMLFFFFFYCGGTSLD